LNNRDIFLLGAIILVGAIVVELYSNFANPLIDYTPGSYASLIIGAPQQFDYYKEGLLIGTYNYTLNTQTSGSSNFLTLQTSVDITYKDEQLTLETTHRFIDEVSQVSYTADVDIGGVTTNLGCNFLGGKVLITTSSQGKNQTTTVTLPANTVIIDNNNPAHWELLMKSFNAEAGKKYGINTFTPQGAVVQKIEFGIDTSHQFVNIDTKSYECIVAREPNFQITLYFYNGNLIQYKNDADGIIIVKRMP
jgi:hypothetical protein